MSRRRITACRPRPHRLCASGGGFHEQPAIYPGDPFIRFSHFMHAKLVVELKPTQRVGMAYISPIGAFSAPACTRQYVAKSGTFQNIRRNSYVSVTGVFSPPATETSHQDRIPEITRSIA